MQAAQIKKKKLFKMRLKKPNAKPKFWLFEYICVFYFFNQSFYRPLRSPQAEKPNSKLNLFFCDLQEKPNTQSSGRILSLSNYELKFKRKHKRLMRFLHPFLFSSDISRWQHEGLPVVLVSVTTWRSDMWPAMKGSLRCFSVLHRNKEGRFPVNRYFCEIALFYLSLSWLLKKWKYR